ncbi:MAG: M13 family metallopeptidase [Bacteroidales bacterium]|nr:M13 family metallopeptidase [Bacteroidales bacterium]
MKKLSLLFLSALLIATVSCEKEPFTPEPSATDPLPLPSSAESNKDLTVQPGDDFWQYCNGAWDAETPAPEKKAIGGVYDQEPVMEDMITALVAEDPSLRRFYLLSDELYAHSEAASTYLQELQAKYPKPSTREECLRMFGRMIMDGISPINLTLLNDYKDGKMIGLLTFPNVGATYQYTYEQIPEAVKADLGLLVEGMGMNPQTLYYNDQTLAMLSAMASMSLDYLYTAVQACWSGLYPYVSAELNASLGEKAWSADYVRQMARTNLNYLISNRFAVKYITPELKLQFQDMMSRLRDAFRGRIQNLDWMSETTKASALEKLEKMKFYVGSPDKWYDDCLPDLSGCKSILEAVHKLMVARTLLYKHLIGTDDSLSSTLTLYGKNAVGELLVQDLTLVNSYYNRTCNCIVILPAFMLPPLIRTDCSEAYQYASIVPIAHEITHGFDSEGAKYDAMGRVRNWWTVADKMAFDDEQAKLIQCFSTLEYDPAGHPGQYTDGARTLTENIADLGGFLMALDAYSKRLEEQGFTGENYTQQLKKFYESYASIYCMKYSAEKLVSIVQMDIHSHCRLRVNGVVMNTDLWYELYDVDSNDILYLPKERRAYIW